MTDPTEPLVAYLRRLADTSHAVNDLAGVRVCRSSHHPARPRSHRRVGRVAAAVLVFGGMVGFTAVALGARSKDSSKNSVRTDVPTSVAPTTSDPTSVAPTSVVPTTLAETNTTTTPPPVNIGITLAKRQQTLADDEWVVFGQTPPTYRFLWAKREPTLRMTMYGDNSGNTININVITDQTNAPSAGPTVELAGAAWSTEVSRPGFALASRFVGDSYLSVSANGGTELAELSKLIPTLATVRENQLPGDLLTPTDDKFVEVTTFDFDSETIVMSAYEVNGKFCTQLAWPLSSRTCVMTLDIDGVMSSVLGGGSQQEPGSAIELVQANGIVRADVAKIRVQMADGQRFDIEPTDLSGQFDVKFWVIAANITPTEGPGVKRVTAYDINGNALATEG